MKYVIKKDLDYAFGGTSFDEADSINAVVQLVREALAAGYARVTIEEAAAYSEE